MVHIWLLGDQVNRLFVIVYLPTHNILVVRILDMAQSEMISHMI